MEATTSSRRTLAGLAFIVELTVILIHDYILLDKEEKFFFYLFALGGSLTPHPISLQTSFCM